MRLFWCQFPQSFWAAKSTYQHHYFWLQRRFPCLIDGQGPTDGSARPHLAVLQFDCTDRIISLTEKTLHQ